VAGTAVGAAVATWADAVVGVAVVADGVVVAAGLPQAVLSINIAIKTIINMDFDW
jgi:hypothetical protein